jgi:hypothetical protein
LRPYFPLERVLSGLFEILARLYGVRFEPADLPTWNDAVRPYQLVDEGGQALASVYVDLFPREDKVQGAWMAPLRTATPPERHVAIVAANFTPPIGDKPALLTHREVETLFHELGHLMHQCLSRVPVRRLAGTSVAWDFVELPSQIMENWTWEREAIDLFAAHHETGERLPDELFERLLRARTYRAASAQMQQLGYAEVDLDLHRRFDPSSGEDPIARARGILAEHVTAKLPEGYAMIASFGHLFASPVGYAAGYYSYKWAEVLDADAFGRFRDEGLFSAEVGRAFRTTILECGDSEEPELLYERFRGREPTVDALLLGSASRPEDAVRVCRVHLHPADEKRLPAWPRPLGWATCRPVWKWAAGTGRGFGLARACASVLALVVALGAGVAPRALPSAARRRTPSSRGRASGRSRSATASRSRRSLSANDLDLKKPLRIGTVLEIPSPEEAARILKKGKADAKPSGKKQAWRQEQAQRRPRRRSLRSRSTGAGGSRNPSGERRRRKTRKSAVGCTRAWSKTLASVSSRSGTVHPRWGRRSSRRAAA